VEDSHDMALLIKHHTVAFFGDSSIVDEARDGAEGLQMALGGEYDMIITGYTMPNLNGEQLAVTLRDRGYDTPIILVCTELGMVIDPLNFDDLLPNTDLSKLHDVFSAIMGDL